DAIIRPACRPGRDLRRLCGAPVEPLQLPAENDVRIQRIGNGVSIFFNADGMPLANGDLAVVTAARHARRSAFLLAAAYAIWKIIVGVDVIELRARLVVPGAPALAAVDSDDRSLIRSDENCLRVVGIDPHAMVVVAARCSSK